MKIFLIIAVALIVGFVAGYFWHFYNSSVPDTNNVNAPVQSDTEEAITENPDQDEPGAISSTTEEEPIRVDTNALSPEQKKLLETFGVNTNSIEVTADMIACAKAKVGEARFEEILGGATPSFFEGLSLATCYQQ